MRIFKKLFLLISIISILSLIINIQNVFATSESVMMNYIDQAVNSNVNNSQAVNSATNIAGTVITVAKVICAGIAVIMLTILAIKYMTSAPGEKADIKKHAITYVVGAVIMFAATGILSIIQGFATSF